MRIRIGCDRCEASAWIGPRPDDPALHDAWCEACQAGVTLAADEPEPLCPLCGAALATDSPRFVELWGELQHLQVVLAAWGGRADGLRAILPDRPRFISDLTPPAAGPSDPPAVRELLGCLAKGSWDEVLEGDEVELWPDPRVKMAIAIAHERRGETAGALRAWDALLAEDPVHTQARLARGALHAAAGRWREASDDLDLAGFGAEARWNRASLRLHRAVESSSGLPDRAELDRARDEAGRPSSYWSDPTVGRLLWTLVVERALAARALGPATPALERTVRGAELQLEFDTFWDRALVLWGYAALGWVRDVARVAAPLANGRLDAIATQAAVQGAALHPVRAALVAARLALAAGDPARAQLAIATLLEREDLSRYRIPCAHCGEGSVGIAEMLESVGDAST